MKTSEHRSVGYGTRISVMIFGRDGKILADSSTQALIAGSSVLVTGSMLLSPLIADLSIIFGVSEANAGWLIVAFTLAASLTLPFAGLVADRFGRRTVIVCGLLLFGLAGAAIGFVTNFEVALVLRALQGIGYASVSPIILTLFGDLYDGSTETTVQGMRVTVNSIVNIFVPVLAGLLIVVSWRYPFFLYLMAVPVALWVWLAVPPIETTNDSVLDYLRNVVSFINEFMIATLLASFFFRFFVFYGMLTYISVLALHEAGLAAVAVGTMLSIRSVVKTLVSTQAGRLSMSVRPAVLSMWGFFIMAVGTTIMGMVPTPVILLVGMILFGLGDGILSPCQKSLVNRLASKEYRGGAMSIAVTLQNAGKVVGPAALAVALNLVGPGPAFVFLGIVAGGIGTACLAIVVVKQ